MERSHSYNLPDGGLYYGELNEAGLPESLDASGMWDDGKRYVGQWKDGKISGVGTMYSADGSEIYGYWWEGELLHEFKGHSDSIPVESLHPQKQNKVTALLIGNDNYIDMPLNNCISDTEAIESELRNLGADVTIIRNAKKSEMTNAIKQLRDKDSLYENVFLFFSGHGATNQGRHYIVAIDEKSSETLPISLEEIDEFLADTRFKNIILVSDACTTIQSGPDDREPPKSSGRALMVFSSNLDSSWDGIPGEHSPFAFGLLEYISKPMNVFEMFSKANEFAIAYALNHQRYQIPVIQKIGTFNTDLCLYYL